MTESPVAACAAGTFRGASSDGVDVWRGIRYALAPTGERRFRDPVAPAPAGEVDALSFGAVAPQQRLPVLDLGADARMDEDCLFLNVWRPAGAVGPLPVMVWLHGGAYTYGAGSQPMYDARSLVCAGDVVVVTLNYRIGAVGFLDLSSFSTADEEYDGNLALKDVLLALRWVQDNIAAFGGDPSRVCVFGESAGGGLVTTLLATPSAAGLFHRAIAESSPATSMYGTARARGVAQQFLREAGLDASTAAGARSLSVDAVVAAGTAVYAAVPTGAPGTLAFAPVVDGHLLPEPPADVLSSGRGLPVPLMIGTNRDEASFFTRMKSPLMPVTEERLLKMFADMRAERPDLPLPTRAQVLEAYDGVRQRAVGAGVARDIAFRLPTLWVAEGHSRVADTWLYRFDHATRALDALGIGATHGAELAYVWGNFRRGRVDPTFWLGGRRAAEAVSRRVQARWLAFAHGEAPDAGGDAPSWPAYDAESRWTLVIDDRDRAVPDLDAPLRRSWGDRVLSFG
ncbi:carboxylesterase/lipase family protein [Microbacterium sp. 4R-513]|uniref:carboxylesterase/lipase family protein n=1 Tax=Microbacterium sp. 4R-513 TaxID=2567934 RepID=UPI0013E14DD5|nr:carboxylesterase/lipase family protein [Microbacterium sp. 4R-513]QIG40842.1 carboxylesterase/lipase family protein [Microbacterium sp. 4R-513]